MLKEDLEKSLSSGAKLWVIANRKNSEWALHLDWYMNFQVARSTLHRTPELSETLKNLCVEQEIPMSEVAFPVNAPMLIPTSIYFPNNFTLRLSYQGDPANWAKALHGIWKNLGSPETRVFLPKDVTPEAFKKGWKKADPLPDLIPETKMFQEPAEIQ